MPLATLRRRALLIRPDFNGPQGVLMQPDGTPYPASSAAFFLNLNDISIRINPNGTISANSLSDLTMRQNRVAHLPAGIINDEDPDKPNYKRDLNFPYRFTHARLPFQSGVAMGEDVIMDQVIGFDLRVFDPDALILTAPSQDVALTPSDPGYESALSSGARPVGKGAYVDLGYAVPYTLVNNGSILSFFSWRPRPKSQLSAETLPGLYVAKNQQYFQFGNYRTYDTWTIEYERDGLHQNNNNFIDEGLDGIDNPGIGNYGVDDNLEAETEPPYLYSLRGFQVIIRAFQNSQQQMRQFTVSHDFTPE